MRSSDPDAGADAATDAPALDDSAVDGGPSGCSDQLRDQRVLIDPAAPPGQIQPQAAWDGEAIWVVYNRPEEETSNFDVFATRLNCGGDAIIEPFRVHDTPMGNGIDPQIAIANGRLLIAWSEDDGTGGTANLHIYYRLFEPGGTPLGDVQELRTSFEGQPVEGNHTFARVDGAADGRFVIAGVRGEPDIGRFAAFAQIITADGESQGEALVAAREPEVTHLNPDVAMGNDSEVWLAYERTPDDVEDSTAMVRRFGDDSNPSAIAPDASETSGPALVAAEDRVWAAVQTSRPGGEVDLTLVGLGSESQPSALFGARGRIDHAPKLAVGSDGRLAVAWFRIIRGLRNEMHALRFAPGDTEPTLGRAAMVVGEPGAPPYQPAVTHVRDEYFFLVYAEGESPYRLVGRFMALPSP